MKDAAQRYEKLARQLLKGRALGGPKEGTPDEALEDELLEQMDACWWKMTAVERDQADRKFQKSRTRRS